MAISEDDIVSALIEFQKQSAREAEEADGIEYESRAYPEAHYNHYGNRGIADLYIENESEQGNGSSYVYEIKSESATRGSTGANEIVRQFNKMREYFFKGSSHEPLDRVSYELCFTPTEYNLRHIYDNLNIYNSTVKQDISNLDVKYNCIVTTRMPDPDNIIPIIFASPNLSPTDGTNFTEYAQKANSAIYHECESFFDEIP